MRFTETELRGAYIVEPELHEDNRGFFARIWDETEFRDRGLNPNLRQCSISFNHRAGTLRGMHWQATPFEESKLVRCTSGAIRDVIADIRPASPTFGKWHAVELSPENHKMLYVPAGFAHGFETLADNAEVAYQISVPFSPEAARGFRWSDPVFAIDWLTADPIMSDRDRSFPDFAS